jgi:Copper amine oxidase, enzyme domain
VLASSSSDYFKISIKTTSVQPAHLQTQLSKVMNTGQVRDALGVGSEALDDSSSYRLLYADGLYGSAGGKPGSEPYAAVIADYRNRKTIYASGDSVYDPASDVSIVETSHQPLPNWEEIQDAAEIAGFGPNADAGLLMPPVIPEEHADGTASRIIHIQARKKDSTGPLIRVQVNMNNRTVIRRITPSNAPGDFVCQAIRSSNSPDWPKGSPGSAIVTITKAGETEPLWTMEMKRPSASSGGGVGTLGFPSGRGSGIELINVKYKNKKILRRAHVPILNINYLVEVGCGPHYRDWANQESNFGCNKKSEEQAPGFRECVFPPKTILDKVDGGNFHGIGYYQIGEEVVFISQLTAGWYRYISEWRFAANGTIFPRWNFGGVQGGETFDGNCVCVDHHHHAYWRFDFDIENPGQSLIREHNSPKISLSDAQGFHTISSETRRDKVAHRYWEIFNADAKHGYALIPGLNDGTKDAYGVGDAWFTKYKGQDEFDDKYMGAYKDPQSFAHLDNLVTPSEALTGRDLVVWYAAHFKHIERSHEGHDIPHTVGPRLVPVVLP